MPVHSWEPADLRPEPKFNVRAQRLPRLPGAAEPYEGGAWVVVDPGTTMTEHVNPGGESELFYIIEGAGLLSIEGEPDRPVKFGDTIFIPPEHRHSLLNDTENALIFLSLWWGGRPAELSANS
ncbi:cupin domain-containing protein [Amycolatopsis pithecellobii]|nr:cupin domain-containing protein [Amycolatopsis pithecellobii]